jgi:hypothetical protein
MAQEHQFQNDKGETIKGKNLVFLNELAGETTKFFVSDDNLKGFDPRQLAIVKGKDLEISTNVKTYQGKMRVVLDKIVELQ